MLWLQKPKAKTLMGKRDRCCLWKLTNSFPALLWLSIQFQRPFEQDCIIYICVCIPGQRETNGWLNILTDTYQSAAKRETPAINEPRVGVTD